MIARTTAVIEPGGVLGELSCAPPLTLRQVRGEDAGRCELRLVGSAAGPLAGDELSLSLRLRAGARATLRATGASLAQGRGFRGAATLSVDAELAEGASLVADP
ncbi:MAG TPA: urease accessory protein UreD, partial [Streptosporangiaceae bacterium]|nr:urease accessory protein UreD [Streptosporangiaceae bacterium]